MKFIKMIKLMEVFESVKGKDDLNKVLTNMGIDYYWVDSDHINICTDEGWKSFPVINL